MEELIIAWDFAQLWATEMSSITRTSATAAEHLRRATADATAETVPHRPVGGRWSRGHVKSTSGKPGKWKCWHSHWPRAAAPRLNWRMLAVSGQAPTLVCVFFQSFGYCGLCHSFRLQVKV